MYESATALELALAQPSGMEKVTLWAKASVSPWAKEKGRALAMPKAKALGQKAV